MRASRRTYRRRIHRFLPKAIVLVLLIASPRQGAADDDPKAPDKPKDGADAVMQAHIDALKVSVAGAANDAPLQMSPQALLRYDDAARRYLAGGVWRIGNSGRPKGLVVLELWPEAADARRAELHHELSSFHPGGLVLTGAAGVAWRPRKSVLQFKPLNDAPPPAPTDRRRLLQMKQLARGFAIKESFHGDVSVLRLLPHPIDRWEGREAGIDDGAMFAFTYGTNPELVLLLECQGEEWQFALARLGGAELNVSRDDVAVQTLPELDASARDDAYTSQTISVPLATGK